MKTCSRCGVPQTDDNFSVRVASPDGLSPSCKICASRDKKSQREKYKARSDEEIEAAAAARPPRACRTCKEVKGPDGYPRDRGRRDGRGTLCLVCAAKATVHYNSLMDPDEFRRRRSSEFGRNRATYRRYRLRVNFDLTPEQYSEMLAAQGGVCAICALPEAATRAGRLIDLAVDHCHTSGAVRALLCNNCNHGLGHFRDSPELMRRAAEYIEKFK